MHMQIIYSRLAPHGSLKLYHFIIVVAVVLALLSQMPSMHSLRHISLCSLVVSIGYTVLVSVACICAGSLFVSLTAIELLYICRVMIDYCTNGGGCVMRCRHAGLSNNAPVKDYSLSSSRSERTFNAFLSISILASVFGNSILPEIQVLNGMILYKHNYKFQSFSDLYSMLKWMAAVHTNSKP